MPNRGHIRASAPTRIDLAGGTIDIWPLYLFHDGACTVNAAISLRAHVEIEPRTDGRTELRSIDTGKHVVAAGWRELDAAGELPLLSLAARQFCLENATLVTRGESPAGAGIAGSSALTIATCGALTRWSGGSIDDDCLLQTAMNVECQTIRVPTGVQDYRPALHGGVAAIELRVDRIARVGLDVDPLALEERSWALPGVQVAVGKVGSLAGHQPHEHLSGDFQHSKRRKPPTFDEQAPGRSTAEIG